MMGARGEPAWYGVCHRAGDRDDPGRQGMQRAIRCGLASAEGFNNNLTTKDPPNPKAPLASNPAGSTIPPPRSPGTVPKIFGMRKTRTLGTCLALIGLAGSAAARAGEPLTFERDVRPILKAYCLDCHGGGEALKGKLDLRLKRFAERGGDSGPAIVAGKPEESYLLDRLRDGEMPPGEKKVPRGADRDHRALDRRRGGHACGRSPKSCRRAWTSPPRSAPTGPFSRSGGPMPPAFRQDDRVRTPDRRVRAGQAPRARVRVRSRGRPAHADPPRGARPHGPAAVAGARSTRSWPIAVPTPTSG